MSVITDFTFNNPFIKNYFLGSDEYVPVAEFMYVNSHPLVRPNFIGDVEALIEQTAEFMFARSMKGGPVNRLATLAQNLGTLLPVQDESKAAEALKVLREIYTLCNKIIAK
jgi:hypothetical protein